MMQFHKTTEENLQIIMLLKFLTMKIIVLYSHVHFNLSKSGRTTISVMKLKHYCKGLRIGELRKKS